MRTNKPIICLLAAFLWLTGCATLPAPQTPVNKNIDWNTRAETLSSIQEWDIKAQIGVRTNAEAQSASLSWQQHEKNYTIQVFGPMGVNSYVLTGSPKRVELLNAQGKAYYAKTPEELFIKQTGWNLPVSDLFYWIRGLPVAGIPADKHFDSFNHLTELTQDGWKIRYLRYTSVDNIDLPSKIYLENPRLNVKIIISQWYLPPSSQRRHLIPFLN